MSYKCPYKYCKNNNIVSEEMAVKVGNRYYCPECLKEKDDKDTIRTRYYNEIDQKANITQLNQVIKRLVNDDGYDADLIIYIYDYVRKNKIKINSPFGFTWVVKDYKFLKAYKEEVITKKANEIRKNITQEDSKASDGVEFEFKPKTSKWMNII